RPGEAVTAGQQAEYAAAVLVRLGARAGQQLADVVLLRSAGRGPFFQVRPEADVDQLNRARVPGARVDQQPGLDRAEGHGDVGPDRRAFHRPGAGVDAAGQVDDHHGGTGLPGAFGPGREPGERVAQATAAADAEQAVDDQVGRVKQGGRIPGV